MSAVVDGNGSPTLITTLVILEVQVSPQQLKSAREAVSLTQQQAAARLGVSQAYLALLESGRRPVTARLAGKIVSLYGLRATALPLDQDVPGFADSAAAAKALAGLGYPGFRHMTGGSQINPAVVLLASISMNDLEVRVIEALPWLILENADLDWEWLIRQAKLGDVQNRLGFLVRIASQAAKRSGDHRIAERLSPIETKLDRSRLAREDTLCQGSLSNAEREWLRVVRSPAAAHWNLLTDLDSQPLPYAA